MARIKQGFLGNASGKLGNVVFSKWRDLQTARQYQPDVHDANSHAQQKQRSRMVALLQYLKPLNKNFIRFFNEQVAKGSTPWAKAIKDNMDAISPEGCLIPEKFALGSPKYPPFDIWDIIYNPFIDRCSLAFKTSDISGRNDAFPYWGTSVLGVYKSDSGLPEYDIRHLLCFLPDGHFFCSFYDDIHEHVFENWFEHGFIWFMYFDTYSWDRHINPNNALTEPRSFKPVPLIEGFNNEVKENPVPTDAISWSFVQDGGNWILRFSMVFNKTSLDNPKNYTMIFWGLALMEDSSIQSDPNEWILTSNTKDIPLGPDGFNGSIVLLYAIYSNDGEQVGRFNRFYINKGTDDVVHPYFEQLFRCNYAHPVSFVQSGNQCAFCGSIDELFSDFIQLVEQGIIHDDREPVPTVEYTLFIAPPENGSVDVSGALRKEDHFYYFAENTTAMLSTVPDSGYDFSLWSGDDVADVVNNGDGSFSLSMSKNRSLAVVFKTV